MSPLTPYALLVDADPDPRQLAADALARAGWEVHQATDAREALTVFLARSPFDLLVVDPTTRDMSAKAMVDVMVRASANLRVLYVSRRDVVPVLGVGRRFLEKPFTAQRLMDEVSALMTR